MEETGEKPAGSLERAALATYLDDLLSVTKFKDYCPNGLQVEGRARIARIVAGGTASLALIEAAIADRADAVLVHHATERFGLRTASADMKGERGFVHPSFQQILLRPCHDSKPSEGS